MTYSLGALPNTTLTLYEIAVYQTREGVDMTEIKIEKLSEEKLKDSSVSGQLLKELRRYIGFIDFLLP